MTRVVRVVLYLSGKPTPVDQLLFFLILTVIRFSQGNIKLVNQFLL